jgi:hypothetical protein
MLILNQIEYQNQDGITVAAKFGYFTCVIASSEFNFGKTVN